MWSGIKAHQKFDQTLSLWLNLNKRFMNSYWDPFFCPPKLKSFEKSTTKNRTVIFIRSDDSKRPIQHSNSNKRYFVFIEFFLIFGIFPVFSLNLKFFSSVIFDIFNSNFNKLLIATVHTIRQSRPINEHDSKLLKFSANNFQTNFGNTREKIWIYHARCDKYSRNVK